MPLILTALVRWRHTYLKVILHREFEVSLGYVRSYLKIKCVFLIKSVDYERLIMRLCV